LREGSFERRKFLGEYDLRVGLIVPLRAREVGPKRRLAGRKDPIRDLSGPYVFGHRGGRVSSRFQGLAQPIHLTGPQGTIVRIVVREAAWGPDRPRRISAPIHRPLVFEVRVFDVLAPGAPHGADVLVHHLVEEHVLDKPPPEPLVIESPDAAVPVEQAAA
jgi:hypothetical protein